MAHSFSGSNAVYDDRMSSSDRAAKAAAKHLLISEDRLKLLASLAKQVCQMCEELYEAEIKPSGSGSTALVHWPYPTGQSNKFSMQETNKTHVGGTKASAAVTSSVNDREDMVSPISHLGQELGDGTILCISDDEDEDSFPVVQETMENVPKTGDEKHNIGDISFGVSFLAEKLPMTVLRRPDKQHLPIRTTQAPSRPQVLPTSQTLAIEESVPVTDPVILVESPEPVAIFNWETESASTGPGNNQSQPAMLTSLLREDEEGRDKTEKHAIKCKSPEPEPVAVFNWGTEPVTTGPDENQSRSAMLTSLLMGDEKGRAKTKKQAINSKSPEEPVAALNWETEPVSTGPGNNQSQHAMLTSLLTGEKEGGAKTKKQAVNSKSLEPVAVFNWGTEPVSTESYDNEFQPATLTSLLTGDKEGRAKTKKHAINSKEAVTIEAFTDIFTTNRTATSTKDSAAAVTEKQKPPPAPEARLKGQSTGNFPGSVSAQVDHQLFDRNIVPGQSAGRRTNTEHVLPKTKESENANLHQTKVITRKAFVRKKPHECQECEGEVCRHVKTDEKLPYKCQECGRRFLKRAYLLKHAKKHNVESPYLCHQCGIRYTSGQSLCYHYKRIHSGIKPYNCQECGKPFSTRGEFIAHMRSHTGEKPFGCQYCGKAFALKGCLVRHIRTHTGERPYKCKECGRGFTQPGNLIKHTRSHAGVKQHWCQQCGRGFIERYDLEIHMRIHTGERPYKCKECGKGFTQPGNLMTHMRTHTGVKPNRCQQCGKAFAHISGLIRHRRSHTVELAIPGSTMLNST